MIDPFSLALPNILVALYSKGCRRLAMIILNKRWAGKGVVICLSFYRGHKYAQGMA
jgi:hypothetical protein